MSPQNTFLNAMENWVNMYLFRSLSEYFDYLKTTAVSMQQAYVITFVHYNGPSKISDICEHLLVSAAAASQMVDRLEKQNLVQRITAPGDRRVRNVVLSEQGEEFVRQSIAVRQNWIQEIPNALNATQLEQVSDALQLLTSIYQDKVLLT